MSVVIEVREVYGAPKAYPVCDKAKTFASMLGTKTLTRNALEHIQRLGYRIEQQGFNRSWEYVA